MAQSILIQKTLKFSAKIIRNLLRNYANTDIITSLSFVAMRNIIRIVKLQNLEKQLLGGAI